MKSLARVDGMRERNPFGWSWSVSVVVVAVGLASLSLLSPLRPAAEGALWRPPNFHNGGSLSSPCTSKEAASPKHLNEIDLSAARTQSRIPQSRNLQLLARSERFFATGSGGGSDTVESRIPNRRVSIGSTVYPYLQNQNDRKVLKEKYRKNEWKTNLQMRQTHDSRGDAECRFVTSRRCSDRTRVLTEVFGALDDFFEDAVDCIFCPSVVAVDVDVDAGVSEEAFSFCCPPATGLPLVGELALVPTPAAFFTGTASSIVVRSATAAAAGARKDGSCDFLKAGMR